MGNTVPEMWAFLKQGLPKDFAFLAEIEKGEERYRWHKCWQLELRAEQNTVHGLHCSVIPGERPFTPSMQSQLCTSRERKRWETKGSLCKSREQKTKRK